MTRDTTFSPREAIDAACARIAPAWPLDRMIAVSPYWGWTGRPMPAAAAELGALSGARLTMPRTWWRARLRNGELTTADLARAIAVTGSPLTVEAVMESLETETPTATPHPLVTTVRDTLHEFVHEPTWHSLAIGSIGRACAAWFDETQASWHPDPALGLYAYWRTLARADAAPRILRDLREFQSAVDELPEDPDALIALALETLGVPARGHEAYLTALLMSVGGWASHAAFRRWEARLAGDDDRTIEELLAIRLAWDLLLFRTAQGTDLPGQWRRQRQAWGDQTTKVEADQHPDWVLQRALELRFHERLAAALARVPVAAPVRFGPAAPRTTRAQAVFCIDVRSEVLRRHLETADPCIVTLGFAGFFGLPIAYAPVAGAARPQLPGLLEASLVAEDVGAGVAPARTMARARAEDAGAWRAMTRGMPAAFSLVEATGLAALLPLMRADLAKARHAVDPLRAGLDAPGIDATPVVTRRIDGTPLDVAERAALGASALRAMSLTEGFARLVAFVGHGATVTNNPQSAGLACGACGGQSGEVNARALAALLNDADVRAELDAQGITIPDETRFIGAVHDTVTDVVTCHADAALRSTHAEEIAALERAFAEAGDAVRRERAPALGLPSAPPAMLRGALETRAADWSEVRPEWALARNAAFIAAPRTRTRPLDLHGRVFLHEYRWMDDREHAVLRTILTAPVVVAHWINMQYHASTVDPTRFGSGDKTLHNVVAGGIGLVEGAGGDLRIGLARQSVHDGTRHVHEPIRLAVYVEAPAAMIDRILAEEAVVRDLVAHEWIHLYRIAPDGSGVYARRAEGWERVPRAAA